MSRFSLVFMAVAVAGGASADVVLRSARVDLTVSPERRGAVTSLVDRGTGTEFVNAGAAADLFRISWTPAGDTSASPGHVTAADAGDVDVFHGDGGLTMAFSGFDECPVTVRCTITASEDRDDVRWRLQVTGTADVVLERVGFPVFELRVPLGQLAVRDAVVAGLAKGGVYHNPAGWQQGQGLSVTQPGQLAAQFGCYYSPDAGMLSYTRDARGCPKVLSCRRTTDGLRWMWERRCHHPLSTAFELGYEISLTTFTADVPGEPADWRDAADAYKTWALEQPWCAVRYVERADIPPWMKHGPGMVRFSREWLRDPERVEEWLHQYWRAHVSAEMPLIVALWGWERVGSWVSPKYFPPFPSEAGFRRVVAAAEAVGGHAFPWPSGYYWNVEYGKHDDGSFEWEDWDDFNRTGRAHALLQRDGTPLVRTLPWLQGGRNAVLCRGDPWTREWFNRTAVALMERGCDMVQVDQVVGGQAPGNGECFSPDHGHPPGPGVWDTDAFVEQLRSLAAACRRVQPDAVIGIEEPQELFNHLVGIQDYRDAQEQRWPRLPGLEHASVFGYLYHEFLPVFQSNPQSGDRQAIAYCIVTGQIPHLVPHWPVRPEPRPANGSFERWVDDVPEGWQRVQGWQKQVFRGRSYRDRDIVHDGRASLRLENTGDTDIVQVSQNIPIGDGGLQAGRRYRLRGWLRTAELAAPNAIRLAALTHELQGVQGWSIPYPQPGDWARGETEFTVPEGADFLRIMIHVQGRCRLWVDELAVAEHLDGDWRPLLSTGLPPGHDLVQRWVELFHGEGRPYLLLGRMLHAPQLLHPAPAAREPAAFPEIMLNAFEAADGSRAAIVVNAGDRQQDVRLRWRGSVMALALSPWEIRLLR